jgi:flap endonuclease-1
MGIKHLFQLIQEHAPGAIKMGEIKNQFGRKVAIVRPPPLPTSSAQLS